MQAVGETELATFSQVIQYLHCDALPDLVPFVQLKKRKKHPWRSFTFSKAAG